MINSERVEISGFELGVETFSLNSYKCHMRFETIDNEQMLCVETDTKEPLYYSFSGMNGLCGTTKYGTIRTPNLILAICSLNLENTDEVFGFFEENGFLFQSPDKIAYYDYDEFIKILHRIKSVAAIISEVAKSTPDPNKLLYPVLYLLLGENTEIRRHGSEKTLYKSTFHPAMNIVKTTSIAINTDVDTEEAKQKGSYSVRDTVYPDIYELNAEKYDMIIAGENPWGDDEIEETELKDEIYRKLATVYKLNHGINKSYRGVVDFLFHFMMDVGVVKVAASPLDIKFYRPIKNIELDTAMKIALVKVAKSVATSEINAVIGHSIRPVFLENNFETTWRATCLHAALYFSLFYMRPGNTIFKRCLNPSCNKYFAIASTNGRKKFCGKKCRDAYNSRIHREKEKKKQASD